MSTTVFALLYSYIAVSSASTLILVISIMGNFYRRSLSTDKHEWIALELPGWPSVFFIFLFPINVVIMYGFSERCRTWFKLSMGPLLTIIKDNQDYFVIFIPVLVLCLVFIL